MPAVIAKGLESSRAMATRRALEFHGVEYHRSEWMFTGEDPELSPTIFMVEQPPNAILPAHFHELNQFQLFVSGSGKIGGHFLAPVTVHYAGAYTGYGPIVAGDEGLAYFTIRPGYERGAHFLSESRDRMRKGPRRGGTSTPTEPLSAEALFQLGYAEAIELLPDSPDGLSASIWRLPPNHPLDYTRSPAALGAFLVILGGELCSAEGGLLTRWGSMFIAAAESWPSLSAGQNGAEVAVMSMPVKHPRFI